MEDNKYAQRETNKKLAELAEKVGDLVQAELKKDNELARLRIDQGEEFSRDGE